jgi:predicted nucleic acid-binding protein
MPFLVDANVLSEATKKSPSPHVIEWLVAHQSELVINPIILGELEYGILQLPAGKRRSRLLDWFDGGASTLQILDIDRETSHAWAVLLAELKRRGTAMPVKDSLIAATARRHSLAMATRNTSDYCYAKVELVNPFRE